MSPERIKSIVPRTEEQARDTFLQCDSTARSCLSINHAFPETASADGIHSVTWIQAKTFGSRPEYTPTAYSAHASTTFNPSAGLSNPLQNSHIWAQSKDVEHPPQLPVHGATDRFSVDRRFLISGREEHDSLYAVIFPAGFQRSMHRIIDQERDEFCKHLSFHVGVLPDVFQHPSGSFVELSGDGVDALQRLAGPDDVVP